MAIVVLEGGSRDGDSTVVEDHVQRIVAASEAPGLVDVYEPTGEERHLAGNDEPARVFAFTAQEPIGELSPQVLHMPPRNYS